MTNKEEIKKVEQAIGTIQDFLQIHINDINPKAISKWADARRYIVEEIYYMKKSIEKD